MKLDGFVGPSYALPQPSANAQRLVNLYLETQEAGPRKGNPARLVGTPGLRKRVTLGAGPIRGVHRATTGQLFVVSGAYLYEVTADWVGLLRPPVGLGSGDAPPSGALNSSSGLVTMEDDGTRILIADGTSTAFQSDLVSGSPLIPVADADCPGGYVTWQDGYFIHSVPNSGEFQISGLNAVTYDPTDVATAEGRPDQLVIPISVNRNLWLFGEQTTEVWWNSGAVDFPFERNSSAFLETGTLSAGSCVRVANSVAWLGNDARGRGTVWYAQGFQPQRISTHAIEYALASYSRLEEATAFAYQQSGHEFYVLNVPGSDADSGGTWVYDFATGQWHERSYLNPSSGSESHRAGCAAVAFGEVVVGDRADGRLYTYDLNFYFDDADPIRRLRQAKHITQGEKRIRFNSFELQAEAGVGLVTGQGQEPIVLLSWSDDGGHTWSNEHPASMGELGKFFTRIKWRRLGVGRDRVFRVTTSEPVAISWPGAEIDAVQLSA